MVSIQLRAELVFALLTLFGAPAWVRRQEARPKPPDAAQVAREALVRLDKGWVPYENKPNLGDDRWKVQLGALVAMFRAGTAAALQKIDLEAAKRKREP